MTAATAALVKSVEASPGSAPIRALEILFVSIAFPPKSDPEALQAARYFKYLVRQPGVAVDVVTSRNPTLWMPTDDSLNAYATGARQQIELPIVEPRLASVALAKLLPSWVLLPDMRQSFHWQWWRIPRKLRRRPDVIYTRSFPLSSAIMGYRLARHFQVPWVMHLSDPWTESAILNFRGLSRTYNLRAQMSCFERAAAITVASPRMLDMYQQRFPRLSAKFHLAPNVYDPEDIRPLAAPANPKLRLVYTGSLQGGRSVRHLLRILQWCEARDSQALQHLSIDLAGTVDSSERQLLATNRFSFVRHLGTLPLQKAQQLQHEADVLLVFDTPLESSESVYFPSKLLDYLITGRPILALTSPGSMTRDIVSGSAGRCFDHGEIEAAGTYLLELIGQHRRGVPDATSAASRTDDRFSAARNATALVDLMRTLR